MHNNCIGQGSAKFFVDGHAKWQTSNCICQQMWESARALADLSRSTQVFTLHFTPADARAPGGRTAGFPSLVQEIFPLPSMVRVTMSSERCLVSLRPWMPP